VESGAGRTGLVDLSGLRHDLPATPVIAPERRSACRH
jgi:hypothetical protein